MTIGELIKKQRELQHKSQKELGAAMNVTQQTIAAYENGLRNPSKEMMQKFATALNIDFADFYFCSNINNSVDTSQEMLNLFGAFGGLLNKLETNVENMENTEKNNDNQSKTLHKKLLYENLEEMIDTLLNFFHLYFPDITVVTLMDKCEKNNLDSIYHSLKKLNELGKQEAVKRIEELSQLEKYTETTNTQTENKTEL